MKSAGRSVTRFRESVGPITTCPPPRQSPCTSNSVLLPPYRPPQLSKDPETERMALGHLILQLSARPPVAAGRNGRSREDHERVGRCIEESLDVDLEVGPRLEITTQRPPFESGGLPVSAAEDGPGFIGDDIPTGNREEEIELPDAEQMGAGHEIDVGSHSPRCPCAGQSQARG